MKSWNQISKPFKNKKASKGKLLIAEPFLNDPYFKRSVVLLTEHNEKGSFGFILNKPVDLQLTEAVDGLPDFDAALHLGGPVGRETMHFLHTLGKEIKGSIKIMDGLYWGGDFEQLKSLMNTKQIDTDQVKFFVGYAGWGDKQLDSELNRDDWIVIPGNLKYIMTSQPDDLWKNILQEKGSEYAILSNFPVDPSFN